MGNDGIGKGRKDLEHRNLLDIIRNRLKLQIGKIHQTFEAKTTDSEIVDHLAIEILDPAFYVEVFVYGPEGEPSLFPRMYHKGNRHKYSIELDGNGKLIN